MEILNRFIKNKKPVSEAEEKVIISKCRPDFEIIHEYWVNEPYAQIKIITSEELGGANHYYVEEAPLTDEQYDTYERIVRILSKEFRSPKGERIDPKDYVFEQAEIIAEKYHRSLGKFKMEEWDKIFYYVVRDLIGYGPLQAIMEDPNIEDISCNGVDMPVYVWHRRFESIPTNITFKSHQALNDFIVKIAHKSAKHISSAQPVLDAMLPEKHRLAATFMKEVS
ncbi:type II/IV secretion system ATPase subunit, partial [Candidatus Bathyarchaeota archaeon]|nr:type II/IV secretion system ATPase subunit [Candidatus Bathyarchaeota archaeon]